LLLAAVAARLLLAAVAASLLAAVAFRQYIMDSSGGSVSAQSDDIEDNPLWRFVDKGEKIT
ncbi:hypothetical protein KSS87_023171, partial [Heliosperma pusillum]